ncbi:hypothetical protein B9G69_001645 [Bdellovibrio sp. SKB1291214]|uniref:hypothetical protein n=1 Tax=Bdellovibrio sp. SKB1291214 TaxID=1732569 RepID=UPI000B518D07|nr:hypothetical protein [Bdellovibrio sp. SKB1291214]UYL09277.1 hypothetical protein B9G69_001645 [Bdellovibrio sp. SKB1291214]
MPKKLLFNLILPTLITLPLAMTGCSFRKEPVKAQSKTTQHEVQNESLELQFNSKSNDDLIAQLDKMSDQELYKNAALDLTIRTKNSEVLVYLLRDRQISPFAYSEASQLELERNPSINSVLVSYQTPLLLYIISELKNDNTLEKWESYLSKNHFNSGSCLNLFQTINSLYYYPNVYSNPWDISINEQSLLNSLQSLSNSSVCKNLKSQMPTSFLNMWMQNELRLQYYRKFNSDRVVVFLKSLGSFQNFSIDVVAKGGVYRIDPRNLVLAALPFGKEIKKKEYWIALLAPMVSTSPYFYHIYYVEKDADSDCGAIDPLCEVQNTYATGETQGLLEQVKIDKVTGDIEEDSDNYGVPGNKDKKK